MVKHTQTICRLPANYFSVFDHFVGLALKELIINFSSVQRVTVKKYFEETDPPMVSQVYMFYVIIPTILTKRLVLAANP